MRLTDEESAMLAGEAGPARQWAIDHQIRVGRYLGAADFVPVSQAHIMADTESLGVAGVEWLERLAALPEHERRVRIPTITDPRGTDFAAAARLKHQEWMLALERRVITAFEALGVLMTDTCINYQTIMPAVFGEHMAYGDTGVVIYSNSVLGARSNFEGGPSALAAGLTGRTPRYGFHLPEQRRATLLLRVDYTPRELHDWGALGGIVGRIAGDYWQVPALLGIDRVPTSDELKHFGAALASYGSVALFHMVGITPEAEHAVDRVVDGHGSHHRSRCARISGRLSCRRGQGRCRGILRAATQPDRTARACRHAGRTTRDDTDAGGDQPTGEAGCRSVRPHRAHRSGRRSRAVRHVLLPELCTRNGGGEWLAVARHQFGEAGQYSRRLRVSAGVAVDARMRRRGVQREDRMIEFRAVAAMGRRVRGHALVAKDGFSARYDLDRVQACSRGRSISWRASLMSDAFWCWMQRRVAWRPPGC